ncbi:MAG: acetate--CoA ligase [Desulfovibrionaceae bacterium]
MQHPDTVESLLVEERVFRPLPQLVTRANFRPQAVEALREQASANPTGYWEEAADELEWFRRWDRVLDDSEAPFYRWFPGARCNIVHNALDRHILTPNKNKLALIWEGEPGDTRKYTYFELYREVNRLAGALRSHGVEKGDRVVIYMPPLPETAMAMLASAKIGAVHILVFAGFSPKALRERIRDAKAKVLITADGFYRNGRVVRLKDGVDQALMGGCADCVDTVVVVRRTGLDVEMLDGRDFWYEELVRGERPEARTEVMEAGDPLFVLYTSGTTGKPKGIVHGHGGYMVGVHRTHSLVFDAKPTDIFWCTADPGWITGHSGALYGPLLTGTTTVLYEGHPNYPQADRLWSIIERHGVNVFYTAPTTVRMLMRFGPQYPKMHDLSSLRILGSVGEPISPEAWMWLYKHVGDGHCPVLDTWWQTETGTYMIAPLPVSLLKPGSVARALPGVAADVVDRQGEPVEPGMGGLLVLRGPWPAMMTGLYNDPEGYKRYFEQVPGAYVAGDVARRDADGYYWIKGRADDVLIIAGHRVGTADLEAAFSSHPAVSESAVIGVPDRIRGEVAKGFVVLNPGWVASDDLRAELTRHLKNELGPVAVLGAIEFRDKLPRTRSGKILRRVLKAEELGQPLPDDLGWACED